MMPSATGLDSKVRSGIFEGSLAQMTVELGTWSGSGDVMTSPVMLWVGSHPGV